MQLTVVSGPEKGRSIPIVGDAFTVGRDPKVNLLLSDVKVSRKHARFKLLPDGRVALHDQGSANGTYVNGQRIESTLLRGEETIKFGDTVLKTRRDGQAPSAEGAEDPTKSAPGDQQPKQVVLGPPPGQRQSAIQRMMLHRSIRRATIVGIVLCTVIVAVAVLFGTGVLSVDEGTTASPPTPDEVVAQVAPSTVFVLSDLGGGKLSRGTGWVFDEEGGLVVTNAHVTTAPPGAPASYSVGTGDRLDITQEVGGFAAGDDARSAELVGEALCEDIAVLRVDDTSGLSSIPLLESQSELSVGQEVVAVGYPATLNLSSGGGFSRADLAGNTGVVSVPETTFEAIHSGGVVIGPYQNVILTDTVINQGNSGGPLVDYDGRLVGMNSAGRNDVQGQNYAIGVDRLREMIPRVAAGEDVC